MGPALPKSGVLQYFGTPVPSRGEGRRRTRLPSKLPAATVLLQSPHPQHGLEPNAFRVVLERSRLGPRVGHDNTAGHGVRGLDRFECLSTLERRDEGEVASVTRKLRAPVKEHAQQLALDRRLRQTEQKPLPVARHAILFDHGADHRQLCAKQQASSAR
jgi:hypothetical protein